MMNSGGLGGLGGIQTPQQQISSLQNSPNVGIHTVGTTDYFRNISGIAGQPVDPRWAQNPYFANNMQSPGDPRLASFYGLQNGHQGDGNYGNVSFLGADGKPVHFGNIPAQGLHDQNQYSSGANPLTNDYWTPNGSNKQVPLSQDQLQQRSQAFGSWLDQMSGKYGFQIDSSGNAISPGGNGRPLLIPEQFSWAPAQAPAAQPSNGWTGWNFSNPFSGKV